MVGNDIIDIAKAKKESNWQRPRFLDKLFTIEEQQIIHSSDNPFLLVWRLWSMKEAAYKLYTQANPSRFYSPKKFKCKIEGYNGIVFFKDFKCYTTSKKTTDYIISEATIEPSRFVSEVFKFNTTHNTNGIFLKKKLMLSASEHFKTTDNRLDFNKDVYGVPAIRYNETKIHISLTHHGKYGAFAIA